MVNWTGRRETEAEIVAEEADILMVQGVVNNRGVVNDLNSIMLRGSTKNI